MDIKQYSWFIVIFIGVFVNALFKWNRQRKLPPDSHDRLVLERVYRYVNGAMIITASLIGLNQVLAGIENPFYLYSQNLDNTHVLIGKFILASFWMLLLAWAWSSKTFHHYVELLLPGALKKMSVLSRPLATLFVLVGMLALVFYPGNQLAVLVTNASEDTVEWVKLNNDIQENLLGSISSRAQGLRNIKLGSDDKYILEFKFQGQSRSKRAQVPFAIGEFSMGLIHIAFDQQQRLRIFDRRVFK